MSKPNESAEPPARIVVERTYRASVRELWDMWTTKEGLESWWGPEGMRVEVQTLEARLGGRLLYQMIAVTPETVAAMEQLGLPPSLPNHGRFSEFRPHQSLAMTEMIDFVPGVGPYEFTKRVEFFPSGEHVRMVVTIDPLHNEEWTRLSREGFTSELGKLDRRFAGLATASGGRA
jgi:uncharacterized protein YndB with AHSA1/START domain